MFCFVDTDHRDLLYRNVRVITGRNARSVCVCACVQWLRQVAADRRQTATVNGVPSAVRAVVRVARSQAAEAESRVSPCFT